MTETAHKSAPPEGVGRALAEACEARRQALGWSQRALAARCGWRLYSLQRRLREVNDLRALAVLAEALGLRVVVSVRREKTAPPRGAGRG